MTDIFISYSHKDEAWKDAIQDHLEVLQTHGDFAIWDDRQIQLGDDWYPEISRAIESARVAILLVSANFLNSDFVRREEIPKLLKRRLDDGLIVIPLVVRPCAWQAVPWLSSLQGGTRDNLPLSAYQPESFELENELSRFVIKVDSLLRESIQLERDRALAAEKLDREARTQVTQENIEIKKQPSDAEKGLGISHFTEEPPEVPSEKNDEPEAKKKRFPFFGWLVVGVLLLLVAAGYFSKEETKKALVASTVPAVTPEPEKQAQTPKRLSFEPEMVAIPAGAFTMGCVESRDNVEGGCFDREKPAQDITLSAFSIGKYEITFNEWDACAAAGKCIRADDSGWGRGMRPVINVSWDDIQVYIQWLKQETGKQYRLPTEAEWEYAARAGGNTAYPWGNTISCENANYANCNKKTVAVNRYSPNAFGLYNTSGNVWEWVEDCWQPSHKGASKSGLARQACDNGRRVLRGGSWNDRGRYCRSAYRYGNSPDDRYSNVGFRLALVN